LSLDKGAEWAIGLGVHTGTDDELALRGGGGSLWSSLICGGDILGGEIEGDVLGELYVGRCGDRVAPDLWWSTANGAKDSLFETFEGIGPLLGTVE
jgi:hypothetical protein